VKSVRSNLEGAEGESELVLGGETIVNVYLSLTLISTNIPARRARLRTLH
jgi:hypothetical protein